MKWKLNRVSRAFEPASSPPPGFVEYRKAEVRCETCGYIVEYPVPYFGDDEAFNVESKRRGVGFRRDMDAVGWSQRSGIAAVHRQDCARQHMTEALKNTD